jgi:hypothetical protein
MRKSIVLPSGKKEFIFFLLCAFLMFSVGLNAQVNISAGSTVTENFNAMGTSATASLPTGWKIENVTGSRTVSTAYSLVANTATTLATTFNAAMSSTAGNGRYNFGGSSSTDRAVGGLSSSSASQSVNMYLQLTNNGSTDISSFTISYAAERFRNGSNTAGFSIRVYYSTTGAAGSYTEATDMVASFSANADNNGATTNPMETKSVSNKTITQTVAAGGSIYLVWNYSVTSGTTTSNSQALGIDDISITANSSTLPTINTSGSLSAISTTYGTASSATSFSISGSNLTEGILVTPPAGFDISTASDFSSNRGSSESPITVGAAGTVSSTTVYLRLSSSAGVASSPYTGNISLSSAGATSKTVALASSTVSAKTLTITGLTASNKAFDGTTDVAVSGTPAYSGLVNGELFSVGGTVSWAFPDATVGSVKTLVRTGSYTAPTVNYTVTQPTLSASINAAVPGAPSITAVTPGNGLLSVAFTAPAFTGGVSISNYEYSTNDGTSFTACSPAQTTSPILISGLTNGITYAVRIRAVNSAGSGASSDAVSGTPETPSAPTIYLTGTLAASTTTYGTAGVSDTFDVEADALTDNLLLTAPAGFELSSTGISAGFDTVLTIASASGKVSKRSIFVRLRAAASAGSYSGNVSASSTGASAVTVSIPTSTINKKSLNVTGLSASGKTYDRNTTVVINGGASYEGLVNGDNFTVTDAVTWSFASAAAGVNKSLIRSVDYAAPSADYTVVQPVITATISPLSITVSGASGNNKGYDGTTNATFSGTLNGVISPDVVFLIATGTFASANVGTGIAITSTATLSGTDKDNYTLVQPTGLSGNINKGSQNITFGVLSNKTGADAPFTLNGTSSSGLTLSYASSNTSVATVSGNLVTITGLGTTNITASQAGDANYLPAADVVRSLTVVPASLAVWSQTWTGTAASPLAASTVATNISSGSLVRVGLGAASSSLRHSSNNWTASNYLTITISAATGYGMNLNGQDLIIAMGSSGTGPNIYTLRSSVDNYAASLGTFTPSCSNQLLDTVTLPSSGYENLEQITFRLIGSTTGCSSTFATSGTGGPSSIRLLGAVSPMPAPVINSALTATGNVGSPFSYTITAANKPSAFSAVGLPSGLTLNGTSGLISGTPQDEGSFSVSLTASNSGGSGNASLSLSIGKGTQSILFNTLPSRTFGDADFTISAIASSALPVSFSSSNTAVATVSGNVVTIVGAGTTDITASQVGDTNWNTAISVSRTLTVNKATQSISFAPLAEKMDTSGFIKLTATASSGLPVSYQSSNSGILNISNDTAFILTYGTATITASQTGNDNYEAAASVSRIQVIKNSAISDQTISFPPIAAKTYGDAPFQLNAIASSGLAVSYQSSDTSVAQIIGDMVYIKKPGTAVITASQSGSADLFNPAPDSAQLLAVNVKSLSLAGVVVQDKIFDSTLSAAVLFDSIVGLVGNDQVSASGSGLFEDINVGTAKPVQANFTLNGANAAFYTLLQPTGLTGNIVKDSQTITFNSLVNRTTVDPDYKIFAFATSVLPVSFSSSDTNVARVIGDTLIRIMGPGTTTITATQAGDQNYLSAPSVSNSLKVSLAIARWTFDSISVNAAQSTSPLFTLGSNAADLGVQTSGSEFSSLHSSALTSWTTPAGNGSVKSLTASNWSVNDYFQFKLNTSGYYNIGVSWDQMGSNTGPRDFKLQYSCDGVNYSDLGNYVVSNDSWSATSSRKTASLKVKDTVRSGQLCSYTTHFRVVNTSTNAISGVLGTSGTSRLDNFTVTGQPCPVMTIQLDSTVAVCYGNSAASLSYAVTAGSPDSFRVTFGSAAIAAGFANLGYQSLSGGSIQLSLPAGLSAGAYQGNIIFKDDSTGCETFTYPFVINYINPSVSISGLPDSICSATTSVTISGSQSPAGAFSGPGVTDNGDGTALFNPSTAGTGVHSVIYSYSAFSGCTGTDTQSVKVVEIINVALSSVSACVNYMLPWGVTVTASGNYSQTYSGVSGQCDTVKTVYVEIKQPVTTSTQVATCDRYILPWGDTAVSTGTYSHTYSGAAANGCDSTLSIELTMTYSPDAGSVSGSDSLCIGTSSLFTHVGGTNGRWESSDTSIAKVDTNGHVLAIAGGQATIRFIVENSCAKDTASKTLLVYSCNTTLNLKLYVYGYYQGGGLMTPKLFNAGVPGYSSADVEDLKVELRSASNGSLVGSPVVSTLKTDGNLQAVFSNVSGSCYIVVKSDSVYSGTGSSQSNILETWSSNAVNLSTVVNYDFSTDASKAYGNNQVHLGSGVYGIYNGDLNQDGSIESTDYNLMENDVISILFGYYGSDINGDGVVESIDYLIMENLIKSIIFSAKPF